VSHVARCTLLNRSSQDIYSPTYIQESRIGVFQAHPLRSIWRTTLMLLLCSIAFPWLVAAQDVKRYEIDPNGVNILTPADATRQGGIKQVDIGPGKVGWIEAWRNGEDSLFWDVSVAEPSEYEVSIIARGGRSGSSVQVEVAGQNLLSHCGLQWERLTLGKVRLPAGTQRVTIHSTSTPPIQSFFSVELVRSSVKQELAARSEKLSAGTEWLAADRYGLMFHWTSETKPETGAPKSYQLAVRDFDVERFAQVVVEMGARHVVFTTSHAGFYFPGPNTTIDSILPGRTCDRDLIGDIATALNKRGIKLFLYYHPGHDDVPWWSRTHFGENKAEFFRQWCAIIREIGQRYGERLAGFWFDDAAFTYYPFNPPWEEMTRAAKAGNAARLVIYNSWVLPRVNDFYEVFAGENSFSKEVIEGGGFLPVGGTGKFIGGPQQGLQGHITTFVEGDWGHYKLDTPIGPPHFSAERLIAGIHDCIRRKNVPTFDIEIYQDGTISPQTFQLFKAVKRVIWMGAPPSSDGLKRTIGVRESVADDNKRVKQLPITRLYAAQADLQGNVRFWKETGMMLWKGRGTAVWHLQVSKAGEYEAKICYASAMDAVPLSLRAGGHVNAVLPRTSGVFLDDTLNFNRSMITNQIRLPSGEVSLEIQVQADNLDERFRVRSIELTPMESVPALATESKTAYDSRASTDWMVKAGYGVMFHWTSRSAPKKAPILPYQEAVERFDVQRFANMVRTTGAGYVIFTVNHADPHCPAPIDSWEKYHPGWTTKRDLIGEIADDLQARGIRLMLYFASHTLGKMRKADSATYLRAQQDILTEIGNRYGRKISGYWFDGWYQSLEQYPDIDPRELWSAVKAGNPDRVVAYNSWIYPVETDLQEYWAGEVGGPVRPTSSRFSGQGPAIGLQQHALWFLDAPWVHQKLDSEMEPLRFKNEELIRYVEESIRHHGVVTLNVGIFQDGEIGIAALEQLQALRAAVRRH